MGHPAASSTPTWLSRVAFLYAAEAAATVTVAASGAVPRWAGLPHHVALPPFDLFADLRVLVARASDWSWLAAGAAIAIGLRAGLLTFAIGGGSRTARRLLVVYLTAAPFGVAGAMLAYSALAVLYSPFLWAGLVLAVIVGLALGPRPWRRTSPVAVSAVAAYVLVLFLISAMAAGGEEWAMAAVPVSALATIAGTEVIRRADRVVLLATPLALLVVAMTVLATGSVGDGAAEKRGRSGSLFLVAGVGGSTGTASMFRLDPRSLGYRCEQTVYFSYAGPGDGAPRRQGRCPVTTGAPYRPADTQMSFSVLVERLRTQLAGLERPVVVATHSQGAWLLTAALQDPTAPPVDAVVMLGPFPGHDVPYPAEHAETPVRVGAAGMRWLLDQLRERGRTSFRPDAPLYRDLLMIPGRVDEVMARAPAGPTLAVTALPDLAILPQGWRLPEAINECVAAHHGHLATDARVHRSVNRFLDGEDVGCEWWRRLPFAVGETFGVPPS